MELYCHRGWMLTYIKPSMDIVKLENVSLLAASDNAVNTELNNVTPGDVTFHSRKFSLWDDAEE